MDSSPASIRDLTLRLLAVEATTHTASSADVHAAMRVCEKLRVSLSDLAGTAGFAALLRRALTLARREFPSLEAVVIKVDGSFEGLEQLAANSPQHGRKEGAAIAMHLLGLLVTLIGEPITRQLLHEIWPNAQLGAQPASIEAP
jgi:hypothetical protein